LGGKPDRATTHRSLERILFVALLWAIVLPALAEPGPPAGAVGAADKKLPVPDQARQQALVGQLKEIYDFSKARTADAKLKLARELFAVAQKSTDDPTERFVLLRQVMELAGQAGQLKLALQAAEVISGQFDVDPLLGKVKVLTDFAREANSPIVFGSLVEETRRAVEQARSLEQFDVAVNLVETVYQAARNRPITAETRKRIQDLRSDLRRSHEAWQSLQLARQTLTANPDDAEANLLVGRWTCLQRADWEAGLRYLSKSGDAALQSAAAKDLAAPQDAAAQVAVADAWYDAVKTSAANSGFRVRAIRWYAAARGQASGLLGVKIDKRLADLGATKEELSLLRPPSTPDRPTAPAPSRPRPAAESPSTEAPTFAATLSTTVNGLASEILGLAFSPDGKSLAATGFGKEIHLLEAGTWRTRAVLQGHSDEPRWLAYSPDGRLLASGSKDRQIRLWNMADGRFEKTLIGHTGPVFGQAFAPDGRTLASAAEDATIRLWDLPSGQHRATLTGHRSWIWSVAFSPDGRRLASAGGNDNTLRLWDVATGKCLAVCQEHRGKVRGVAFLPDGKSVASTSEDKTLRLWDVETGQLVNALRADGQLFSLTVAPQGGILAAAGPGFIRFWESSTGRELLTVPESPAQATWALAFSPDQRWLVSGGSGKILRVWSLRGR
jgi:dipeptidyl aminopeptidase/acylaminoacyl peptidase